MYPYIKAMRQLTEQGIGPLVSTFVGVVCVLAIGFLLTAGLDPLLGIAEAVLAIIALACFTRGRVRQFFASILGTLTFLALMGYFALMLGVGEIWPTHLYGSEPSAAQAFFLLLIFGLPSARYVLKVRFGLRRSPEEGLMARALKKARTHGGTF